MLRRESLKLVSELKFAHTASRLFSIYLQHDRQKSVHADKQQSKQ